MREGDDTYRLRDHVNANETNDGVVGATQPAEELPDNGVFDGKREGDDTFRPRQTIAVKPAKDDRAPEDRQAAAVEDRDGCNGIDAGANDEPVVASWLLQVPFILSVFILSALFVKFAFWMRDAFALPIVLRELAISGIVLCSLAICYAAVALFRALKGLPRMEQSSRKDAFGKNVKSKDQAEKLHEYLLAAFQNEQECADYERRVVRTSGCARKLRLLRSEIDDYEDWMGDFSDFEKMQDAAAEKCIAKRSGLVFIKTGLSPWKLVDIMSVLYHSVMMATELAKIYRRRVTRYQAFRLASLWKIP